jgi:hypothetical protein
MRRIFYVIIIAALFGACKTSDATRRVAPGVWEDATLAAELRAELGQLKRDLAYVGELSAEIAGRIDSLTDRLVRGLDRSQSIKELLNEIDIFVRGVIEENSKLRNLCRPDWGEDAGER